MDLFYTFYATIFFMGDAFILIISNQVSSSLNSSYCYILHSGNTVFTWSGSLATTEDQELMERQLDLIKVQLQAVA